jgi:serine/threonine protein kinase, bacterial
MRGWNVVILVASACNFPALSQSTTDAPVTVRDDARVTDDAAAPTEAPGAPGAAQATAITNVTTLAGTGSAGSADGMGSAASFNGAGGIIVDVAGTIYVADPGNNLIRVITPAGLVTTLAGNGSAGFANGTGSAAQFNGSFDVAVNAAGDIYVTDGFNERIREVTSAGVVTTLAGTGGDGSTNGSGSEATFSFPCGVATDSAGNVYVSDFSGNRIREVTPAGVVSTFAGTGAAGSANGSAAVATFNGPKGVAVDSAGNLYVGEQTNNLVRKITPAGEVSTLAGTGGSGSANGSGSAASFNYVNSVAVDANGNVFVADVGNNLVRKVTPAGLVTTLAGTGSAGSANGPGSAASFNSNFGIAVDSVGNVYVADTGNNLIRKIDLGIGQLAVTWSPPSNSGTSAITSYTASASALGQATKTCTVNASACTISGLTSGVAYSVSVTASNAAGESAPSTPSTATPN